MLWVWLIHFVLLIFAGRWIARRAIGCFFWILVLVVGALVLFAIPAHAAGTQIVQVEALTSEQHGPHSDVARGLVYSASRTIRIPADLATDARVWLAASPDGTEPINVDDELRLDIVSAGRVLTVDHDFRSTDRQTTEPFGPIELTSLIPRGVDVTLNLQVIDLAPPLWSTTPLYLVITVPEPTATPVVQPTPTVGIVVLSIESPTPTVFQPMSSAEADGDHDSIIAESAAIDARFETVVPTPSVLRTPSANAVMVPISESWKPELPSPLLAGAVFLALLPIGILAMRVVFGLFCKAAEQHAQRGTR